MNIVAGGDAGRLSSSPPSPPTPPTNPRRPDAAPSPLPPVRTPPPPLRRPPTPPPPVARARPPRPPRPPTPPASRAPAPRAAGTGFAGRSRRAATHQLPRRGPKAHAGRRSFGTRARLAQWARALSRYQLEAGGAARCSFWLTSPAQRRSPEEFERAATPSASSARWRRRSRVLGEKGSWRRSCARGRRRGSSLAGQSRSSPTPHGTGGRRTGYRLAEFPGGGISAWNLRPANPSHTSLHHLVRRRTHGGVRGSRTRDHGRRRRRIAALLEHVSGTNLGRQHASARQREALESPDKRQLELGKTGRRSAARRRYRIVPRSYRPKSARAS
jgi:hypothetical protein